MENVRQLNNLCGIDVGCTNIKMVAIVDNTCIQKSVPSGDELTSEYLNSLITEFYESFKVKFKGLGIAFSGCTIDGQSVYHTPLTCVEGLNTSAFSHLGCENVKLINDANATALAGTLEYPESKVLVAVTNGTSIGAGVVINGLLFTGSNGFAGEIYGNPTIVTDGEVTKIGRICSGAKIMKKILHNQEGGKTICKKSAVYMGSEIVSLIHSFNPDTVYLSGGGFNFENYLDYTLQFVYSHTYPSFLTNLKIVQSGFSNYSGCYGAMKNLLM